MKQFLIVLALLISGQLTGTAFGQTKTAHVNTKTLMDTLPSRKMAVVEIQEVTQRGEAELMEMDKVLQKAYSDYMAVKESQSAQVNQYEESKLQKMQQDIQKREQELTAMIQNMTIAMNDQTYKAIKEAAETVAAKKGFQYVLEEATTIVATGPSITNDVIAELLRLDAISSSK